MPHLLICEKRFNMGGLEIWDERIVQPVLYYSLVPARNNTLKTWQDCFNKLKIYPKNTANTFKNHWFFVKSYSSSSLFAEKCKEITIFKKIYQKTSIISLFTSNIEETHSLSLFLRTVLAGHFIFKSLQTKSRTKSRKKTSVITKINKVFKLF